MHTFILRLFNIKKNEETLINNYVKILNFVLKGYKTEYLENYVHNCTSNYNSINYMHHNKCWRKCKKKSIITNIDNLRK